MYFDCKSLHLPCFLPVLLPLFLPALLFVRLPAFPRCRCLRRGSVLSWVTRSRSVRPAGVCAVLRGRFPVQWWWSGFPILPPLPPLPPRFRGGVACRSPCVASVRLCGVFLSLLRLRLVRVLSVCPFPRCLPRPRGCVASPAAIPAPPRWGVAAAVAAFFHSSRS